MQQFQYYRQKSPYPPMKNILLWEDDLNSSVILREEESGRERGRQGVKSRTNAKFTSLKKIEREHFMHIGKWFTTIHLLSPCKRRRRVCKNMRSFCKSENSSYRGNSNKGNQGGRIPQLYLISHQCMITDFAGSRFRFFPQ